MQFSEACRNDIQAERGRTFTARIKLITSIRGTHIFERLLLDRSLDRAFAPRKFMKRY